MSQDLPGNVREVFDDLRAAPERLAIVYVVEPPDEGTVLVGECETRDQLPDGKVIAIDDGGPDQ